MLLLRPRPSRLSDWLPYVLGVALVAALVFVLAAASLRAEHERRRAYAQGVVRNLALLIEAQVAGLLWQADLALRQRAGFEPDPDPLPAVVPSPPPGLQVSGPERDERGQWVLRLQRANARAGGPAVELAVPVDRLGAILDRVQLGPHGAATLRSASMALVWRQPMPPGGTARLGSTEVSNGLRDAVARSPQAGDFDAPTALDGIARLNAYQRVDGFPLYVIVGLPEDEFPRGWSRMDAALLALSLGTLLTALLSAWVLYKGSRRQIDRVHRRYQAIVEGSHDAIISKTLDGIVTSWNPAAERIFGWSEGQMVGQSLLRLFPAERLEEEHDIIARIRRGETIEAFETERLRADGGRVSLSVTISPVRDADGRVVGASKIARDISRQKSMEAEIRALAFLDPLTQLPNRRLLRDRLQQAQQASRRSGHWCAAVYMDLDGFKTLNDTHGHEVGDLLLQEIARRLRAAVRETDTVARLGGDEFVLLCNDLGDDPGAATEAVLAVEAKVVHALERPWQLRDIHLVPRASLGHRLFQGVDEDVELLLREADARMYEDKQRRRGGR